MKNLNKVTLIGYVGESKGLKTSKDKNKPLLPFTLATNNEYVGKDGKVEKITQWHNVLVTGKQAEVLAKTIKLTKGDYVYVEGSIQYSSYKNKGEVTIPTTTIFSRDTSLIARKVVIEKKATNTKKKTKKVSTKK